MRIKHHIFSKIINICNDKKTNRNLKNIIGRYIYKFIPLEFITTETNINYFKDQ